MKRAPHTPAGPVLAIGEAPQAASREAPAHLAADQQRTTYIDAAAHDMKGQLTLIRATAQLLERQQRRGILADPDALLHGLATIQLSTRKLQRLVDEFLDLSRVQSGAPVEFNLQPTDLVAVARACVREHAEAGDHDLTFTTAADTIVGL